MMPFSSSWLGITRKSLSEFRRAPSISKVRTIISQEHAAAFETFDLLISPTSPTVAFKLGEKAEDPLAMYLSDLLTIPSNMAGLPGLSIPCGLSEGLPVGLQLIGPQRKLP